jgi:hypothetical protein
MMAYIGVLITKSFPALIIQKATLFLQNASRLHDNAARALPTLPQCNYKIHLLIALSGAAPKKNQSATAIKKVLHLLLGLTLAE